MVSLNRQLAITIPLDRGDGQVMHAYSTPIGQHVFDRYFMVLGKTFSAIYAQGLGPIAGARVAYALLKQVSEATTVAVGQDDRPVNAWVGTPEAPGVEAGLVAEMRRLTTVYVLGPEGWAPQMMDVALRAGILDADDEREVLNALTFFTVTWWVNRKTEREVMLRTTGDFSGWEVTASSPTEFAASLRTSTTADASGEKAKASSTSSSTGSAAPASDFSQLTPASTIPT